MYFFHAWGVTLYTLRWGDPGVWMSFPALTMLNADRIAYFCAVVHQKSVLYVDSISLG